MDQTPDADTDADAVTSRYAADMGRARRNARRGRQQGGGGYSQEDDFMDSDEVMQHILEMMAQARAEEQYRERRRARYRAGPGDFFMAIIGAVLSMIAGIVSELFPKKVEYEQRHGRRRKADDRDGDGDGHEETFNNTGRGDGDGDGDDKDGAGGDEPAAAPAVSQDPFEALGIPREGATAESVAKGYKKMAIKWHPDKNGQSAESVSMMQAINAARAKCLSALKGGAGDGDEGVGLGRRTHARPWLGDQVTVTR